jgi:outer membrane protein TolC
MAYALIALALLAAGTAPANPESAPVFAGNEELRAYLVEAAAKHPELKKLHEEWLAALEVIPQATSLDDPMFSYGQFVRSRMEQFTMMLEQQFPWFGTRKLRGQQAAAEAEAVRWRMFAARNEIFARLKEAYFEYAYLAEQIRVADAQIELLAYAEEVVRSKYSFGMASQDELLRIQTEQSQVQDMRAQMDQMRPALTARLDEALGRLPGEEIRWPQAALPPPEPPAPPLVTAWIRTHNPEVLAMDHDIESREKGVTLAKRKNYPDVTMRVEYMNGRYSGRMKEDPRSPGRIMAYRDLLNTATGAMPFDPVGAALNVYDAGLYSEPGDPPDNKVALGFTVNLPVWRKRIKGGVQEALHRVRAAELDQEAIARALDREARMALFEIQDAQRRQALYETDLIPKANQTYAGIQAAYATGMGGPAFIDTLDSIRALLEFELQKVRAVRDLQQASARLEMILGGPWTDAPSGTPPAPVVVDAQ